MAIPESTIENFRTLQRAMENGNIGLLEVTDKKTGEVMDAIVAMHTEDGMVCMTPFAVMFRENPFDRLLAPEAEPEVTH